MAPKLFQTRTPAGSGMMSKNNKNTENGKSAQVRTARNEVAGIASQPDMNENQGARQLGDAEWKQPHQVQAEQTLASWFGNKQVPRG